MTIRRIMTSHLIEPYERPSRIITRIGCKNAIWEQWYTYNKEGTAGFKWHSLGWAIGKDIKTSRMAGKGPGYTRKSSYLFVIEFPWFSIVGMLPIMTELIAYRRDFLWTQNAGIANASSTIE